MNTNRSIYSIIITILTILILVACSTPATQPPPAQAPATEAPQAQAPATEAPQAQAPATESVAQPTPSTRFDPDNEKDSINWDKLEERFGPVPTPSKPYKIGSIMKFMGNPYWQLLAKGMEDQAKKYGLTFEVQAALSEADQA
ncbi:MAG: hypothetical protein QXU75_08060, partial [Candidatus Methanomethylicaceae archaeon]